MAKKETASSSVRMEKPATTRARTTKHNKAAVSAPEPVLAAVAAHDVYDREAIAKLAYLYAEQRGFQGGSPESDWVRAEAEFRGQKSLIASA